MSLVTSFKTTISEFKYINTGLVQKPSKCIVFKAIIPNVNYYGKIESKPNNTSNTSSRENLNQAPMFPP